MAKPSRRGRPNQAPGKSSGGGNAPTGGSGNNGFPVHDPDDDGPSPMVFIAVALMLFFVVRAKSRGRSR